MELDPAAVTLIGSTVLKEEGAALLAAAERLDGETLTSAVEQIHTCSGKVLTTGAGTSGVIARKIAATLTSIGTPSLFLHPSDAVHGGLGVVESGDVVLAVSNSGETGELLAILPYLRHRHIRLISIVGNLDSSLARQSDIALDAVAGEETGPMQLAPTTSTTLALAVGDALAMSVLGSSGLTHEGFARNHPSGRLGRRLTLRVEDVIDGPLPRPAVGSTVTMMDAIEQIGAGGVGAVLVLDGDRLVGIITDGDVRRALRSGMTDPMETLVNDVMTPDPEWVALGSLAYAALQRMEDRDSQISVLPVVDAETGHCVGIIRVHDLVRAGL